MYGVRKHLYDTKQKNNIFKNNNIEDVIHHIYKFFKLHQYECKLEKKHDILRLVKGKDKHEKIKNLFRIKKNKKTCS